ncbi:hypothetical protein ACQEVB_28530 [Pseudonocardia sp. CA-107938]|uniref:hypothetical protein n=1 Tax=Pseudonocardia sp. CA-107938 TaxID=3240021 RepID=UPI003D93889A
MSLRRLQRAPRPVNPVNLPLLRQNRQRVLLLLRPRRSVILRNRRLRPAVLRQRVIRLLQRR